MYQQLNKDMTEKSPYKKRKMESGDKYNSSSQDEGNIIPQRGQSTKPINYRVVLARKGYLVHETLGSGSYSKVKRAINMFNNGEFVAIKIIDRQKAPADYQERFLPRELEVWPKLRHGHLLRLQEVFQDGRKVYMVTDYAAKGDVLKYIQDHGAVSENQARTWIWQVCDAVRYMHNLNFAHRDLKLENLLLDSHMNIKVGDFGFVRKEAGISLSSTYCGSKSYAAPEILVGRPYNPKRSDIWAIGVILYIVTTGKMPFDESKGTRHILKEQESLKLHWPRNINFSEKIQHLIVTMFTWSYEKRPDINAIMRDIWFKKFHEGSNRKSSSKDSAIGSDESVSTSFG